MKGQQHTFQSPPNRPAANLRAHALGNRGIAIFVVVLVLTILTAVGMFAAHISGLNQRASGYAKQGTQTSYVAQYGIDLAASRLSQSGGSGIMATMVTNGPQGCEANQGLTAGECYQLKMPEVQRELANSGSNATLFAPDGGSFGTGSYATPRQGNLNIEIFDKVKSPIYVEGDDVKKPIPMVSVASKGQVTLEAAGAADAGACSTPAQIQAAQVMGMRQIRAYMTVQTTQ